MAAAVSSNNLHQLPPLLIGGMVVPGANRRHYDLIVPVTSWPIRHLLIGNWLGSRYLFCPLLGNGPPGSRQFPVDWLVAYGENIGNEYLERGVGVMNGMPRRVNYVDPRAVDQGP